MKRFRLSTFITIVLLIYLGVMSYIGRGELFAGNYLYYFGMIIITLCCIALLNYVMRRRGR